MRELTLRHNEIAHPDFLEGRTIWRDPSLDSVIHKLHHGDPTKGWEGDPRLAVYFNPVDKTWELHRLEADGQYRICGRSKPGIPFDDRVIDELVARDVRRGFDPHMHIVTQNTQVSNRRSQAFQEWVREEIRPALEWHAAKGRVHESE